MVIAQMNWGLMRFPPDDPRMSEFMNSLSQVYKLAGDHPGFVWRIQDDVIAHEIGELGFDNRMSATVSVWKSIDDLREYTFNSLHGNFLTRAPEWFEKIDDPQLVIWDVDIEERPSFIDAWDRLQELKRNGPSARGYSW